jgi:hypothetical protein
MHAISLILNPEKSTLYPKMVHGVKDVFVRNHKLVIQLNELASYDLKVYDMTGRIVFSNILNSIDTEITLPLNSAYNIVIESRGEGVFNKKAIVK